MRGENESSALFDQELKRGQCGFDAGVVGDDHLPVFFIERNIVIDPEKNAFAAHIEISNCQLCHKLKIVSPAGLPRPVGIR
jgi:hypothetical protein